MADSSLTAIRSKVRKLTRSPSVQQLTVATLDEYVNTFIAYCIPEHLRLFALRKTLTFYLQPYQDVYATNTVDTTDPLYQFKDRYITVHDPVYIGGYQVLLSQSREHFFNIYPRVAPLTNEQISDGTNTYTGTLSNVPIVRNSLSFAMVNALGFRSQAHDTGELDPVTGLGELVGTGISSGTIDYVTGAYTVVFDDIPATGTYVTAEYQPYVAARPQSILYFNNEFTVRPIPDKAYSVVLDVYARPTELLAGESPELEQWWQYISYGAAKLIFEDRMDMDSVQLIMPEFKQQELMVLRRTLVQQSNERTSTIFTEMTEFGIRGGWGSGYY